MTEITQFEVVPFDYVGNNIVAGEPIRCPTPAAAIERAQGLWEDLWPRRRDRVQSHQRF